MSYLSLYLSIYLSIYLTTYIYLSINLFIYSFIYNICTIPYLPLMLYQKYNNIFRKKRVTGRRRKTMMTWMKRIALLPSTLRARTICTSPASTEYTGRIQAQGTFSYSCMMIKRTIFYILIQINIHILKINDRLVRNNEAYIQKWRRCC